MEYLKEKYSVGNCGLPTFLCIKKSGIVKGQPSTYRLFHPATCSVCSIGLLGSFALKMKYDLKPKYLT